MMMKSILIVSLFFASQFLYGSQNQNKKNDTDVTVDRDLSLIHI